MKNYEAQKKFIMYYALCIFFWVLTLYSVFKWLVVPFTGQPGCGAHNLISQLQVRDPAGMTGLYYVLPLRS